MLKMADITVPAPIQFPHGTTVGLLILQSTSPITVGPETSSTLAPLVTMAPAMTTIVAPNNNNNNNNTTKNNNISKGCSSKYQKAIKPATAKRTSKKAAGGSPPLKPPKKEREEDNEIHRCKRRLDFAKLGLPFTRANPVSVARRNERERRRVKQINNTFLALRDHLPSDYCQNKNPNKMSKVETLRGAIDYINSLQDVLDGYDDIITTGAYNSENTAPQQILEQTQQYQPQQEVNQQHHHHHHHQQDPHQPQESMPSPEMTTSEVVHNVNRILSIQATDASQNIAMNSPTGSTCSSVCSSTGSVGNEPANTDYFNMPYGAHSQEQISYHQQYQDNHPPLDIKEEDLIEFAKWF